MKKFVFTLEKVYSVKTMEENKERDKLLSMRKRRERMQRELHAGIEKYDAQKREYQQKSRTGMDGQTMQNYGNYFEYLLQERERIEKSIKMMTTQIEASQKVLLALMNELKVLDRIKEDQLQEYNKQVRIEEDKLLEDFISARV